MSLRHQITDRQSFEASRHPAFVQAVNRVANLKCIEAIKSGKLRVVAPQPISSTPHEYTPRYVRIYIFFPFSAEFFSRMDLIDDPAESILTSVFEIPGVKTEDISLRILDGHLVVSGERRPTYNTTRQSEASPQDTAENGIQAPKPTISIQELRFGTFRRAIRIPEGLKVRIPFIPHVRSHVSSLANETDSMFLIGVRSQS
jgi:HSP20 family molecular chaperone IbpA